MTISCGLLEGAKYDIGFKDASGNDIGLMLTRDPKTGMPNYKEWTDAALAYQYSVGGADYSSLEPMKEIQIGQSSFHQGFGAEFAESNLKYYTGSNIDTRFKNQVICAPLVSAATLPSIPALSNTGFETYVAPNFTGWTYSETHAAFALSQESTIIDTGSTYSAKIGRASQTAAGQTAQLLQTISNWSTALRNTTWTVTVRAYNANIAKIKASLVLDDGVAPITAASTGSAAWETLTATIKIGAAATKLDIICKIEDIDGVNDATYSYFDNVTMPLEGVRGIAYAEFDSDLFIADGNFLLRMNNSTGTITIVAGFINTITDLKPFQVAGVDYLFIFFGTSKNYWYMTTGEVFTESTAVVKTFQYGMALKTTADTMYANDGVNTVRSTTNPLNGGVAWSAQTIICSSSETINKMLGIAGVPYIFTTKMAYYIDSTGAVKSLAPQLISEQSSTSGVNTTEWQGNIYIPCGAQALYEYDTSISALTDISPSKYVTNSTDFDGIIQALSGDSQYLYAALDNGTKTEVLAGRWETIGGSVSWIWHTLASFTFVGCYKLYASAIYKSRLWISSTSASEALCYFTLTSMYGNITGDTDYRYQTGGNLVTSYMACSLMGDYKGFYKITLTMADTTANIYWRAYYEKLGDTTWTEINSTAKFKTSPTTSAYLPVDGSSNKPTSTMIRFKFEPVTNDNTKTPRLLGYDVRALWFPPIKTVITCQVRVADNLVQRDGQVDESQSMSSIRTALNAWVNPTVAWARAFYPLYWASASDTVYGKLMPTQGMEFCYPTVFEENRGAVEWNYNLTILLISGLTF